MKNKTIHLKYDPSAIHDEVKKSLGVDLKRYVNEDTIGSIVDLLLLPKYIVLSLIKPLLLFSLIYITPLTIIPLFNADWFLYFIIGVFLCILNGITFGIYTIFKNITNDFKSIIEYITEMFTSVLGDVKTAYGNSKNLGYKNILLVLKGVILVVINPTLSTVISKKIPFVDKAVAMFTTMLLNMTVGQFEVNSDKIDEDTIDEESTNRILENIGNYVDTSIKCVRAPISLIASFTMIPLMVLLYIVLW